MLTHGIKRLLLVLAGIAVAITLVIAAALSVVFPSKVSTTESAGSSLNARDNSVMPGMPSVAPSYDGDNAYDSGKMVDIAPMPPEYQTGGQTAAEVDQKIIKTGSFRLTVDKVSDALDRLAEIAKLHEGFVQSSSSSERGDGKRDGYAVLRVPTKDFEAAGTEIKALAKIVNNESSNGQDVTEQYTDLQAQLRNQQAQEEEYLRILKKATSVQDILQVQERLGYVRGQIESLQGRIKYLENATSYSTIQVSLSEETSITLPTKEFRPVTVVKQAVQALIAFGQGLLAALIWVVIVGGGVAVPLLLIWAVVRAWLRSRRVK